MELTEKSKVFTGLFWKFGERILAQVVSFIVSIILARIMLPEHYGVIAVVTIFIDVANVFVTSGLSTALIQKHDADEKDFSTVFWCTLGGSIIIYFLMFLSAGYIAVFYDEPILKNIVRVLALKIIISSYNSIQHAFVSRHMMFKNFFLSTLLGTVVSGVVGIGMAAYGFGVWALVIQYLTNSCMDTIVLAFTIPWHPKIYFSKSAARSLIGYGWKILIADLVGTIYNNFRQLLIGKEYMSSDLAFYNKGKQIPDLISTNVDSAITSVLFPAMSNVCDNMDEVKSMTRRSLSISSYIIFPIMLGLAAIAKPLIVVLLTEKWIDSVFYLQVICIAKAIASVSNVNLQAMKAIGRSDIVLNLEIKKKPIGIIIILCALKISVKAVAITMPIYSVYAVIVNMKPNKKLLGYTIKEQVSDLFSATVLSILMFIIIYILNIFLKGDNVLVLLVDVVVALVFYLGASAVFRVDSFRYLITCLKKVIYVVINYSCNTPT